jgi:hypothetical protein
MYKALNSLATTTSSGDLLGIQSCSKAINDNVNMNARPLL